MYCLYHCPPLWERPSAREVAVIVIFSPDEGRASPGKGFALCLDLARESIRVEDFEVLVAGRFFYVRLRRPSG